MDEPTREILDLMDEGLAEHMPSAALKWRRVLLCPGCSRWSIDYVFASAGPKDGDNEDDAVEAAHAHRSECPAYDMLCGLIVRPLDDYSI